ncbi:hypothetical protein ABZZ17_04165 [Streptomyces sp. NPDC006512]|uniref:hypothetical protein n=1 Tax=Streptomyces sp. NPDC006512 TaxID=3154307 RepID=UPI0033BEA815
MANVRRIVDVETREVEVFELVPDEAGLEAMRTDPEAYVREVLADEIGHINGVSVDVHVLGELAKATAVSGGPYVVHHTVSGKWESWVEVTNPK